MAEEYIQAGQISNGGMIFEHVLCFFTLFVTHSFMLSSLGMTWAKLLGLSLIVAISSCPIRN